MPDRGLRTTPLGARIGFHETQLPRSERELLAVFFDELGARLMEEGSTEGGDALAQRRRVTGWSHVAEAPEVETAAGLIAGGRTLVGDPSSTSRPSLFDNKEAA